MLTEAVSSAAVHILETTGYAGAALLMTLESMIAPVPSEAVMPFVGFLVADGRWGLVPAVAATTLGSLIGSWLSWLMGRYGGRPFILRVGKYFLLDLHDLELTERFFHGRRSYWAVFISRFVPVVRHLISIPAGMGRMPLLPFLGLTLVGATMWNGFLLWLGMVLRERWGLVRQYAHEVDIVVVAALAVVGGAFICWKRKCKRDRLAREASPAAE